MTPERRKSRGQPKLRPPEGGTVQGAAKERDFEDLDARRAARFMALGVETSSGLVEAVCYRLEQPDGAEWCKTVLGAATGRDPLDFLASATIAELEQLKSQGKRALAASDDHANKLAGAFCYYAAVACAATRGARISSRPPHELTIAFLDLAAAAPAPWDELFARAAAS